MSSQSKLHTVIFFFFQELNEKKILLHFSLTGLTLMTMVMLVLMNYAIGLFPKSRNTFREPWGKIFSFSLQSIPIQEMGRFPGMNTMHGFSRKMALIALNLKAHMMNIMRNWVAISEVGRLIFMLCKNIHFLLFYRKNCMGSGIMVRGS